MENQDKTQSVLAKRAAIFIGVSTCMALLSLVYAVNQKVLGEEQKTVASNYANQLDSCKREVANQKQFLKTTATKQPTIDVVAASPDKFKVILENDFVRIVEYTIQPGEKDNTHTHPAKTSYVISGGTLRVYPENEKAFDAVEVTGASSWADYRGKHRTENIGTTVIKILLTEIK